MVPKQAHEAQEGYQEMQRRSRRFLHRVNQNLPEGFQIGLDYRLQIDFEPELFVICNMHIFAYLMCFDVYW